jgi:hypothetical protein
MQNCQMQTILRNIPTLHRMPSSSGTRDLLASADKPVKAAQREQRRSRQRKLRALAEAIILQSIEDLWSKTKRKESIAFFTGYGFSLCADMAGMKVVDRLRLFRMLRKLDCKTFDSRHARKVNAVIDKDLAERLR